MVENTRSARQLVASDRVEGTRLYDASGHAVGTVKRLMIDKVSGQVAYVVVAFGGLLDLNKEKHAIPWDKLRYDTQLHGYRTDLGETELKGAPTLLKDDEWVGSAQEEALDAHFRVPPPARSI